MRSFHAFAAGGDDGLVVFVDAVGEGILPEVLSDNFLWIELWAVGWQTQQADIIGRDGGFCGVPAGSIDGGNGMRVWSDLAADFEQMQVHWLGIGTRHDQRRAGPARGADGIKDIGAVITLIA
jgi:hypothetical protein